MGGGGVLVLGGEVDFPEKQNDDWKFQTPSNVHLFFMQGQFSDYELPLESIPRTVYPWPIDNNTISKQGMW